MKEFFLHRTGAGPRSTAGSLEDGEAILCATLERAFDDTQHPCIPAGEYELKLRLFGSSRFDPDYRRIHGESYIGIIEIAGVPKRTAIEFHKGNWWWQSEGCIMGGTSVHMNPIKTDYEIPGGESGPGFWKAYQVLIKAIQSGGAKLRVFDIQPKMAVV